jgi:hypothetical protein
VREEMVRRRGERVRKRDGEEEEVVRQCEGKGW